MFESGVLGDEVRVDIMRQGCFKEIFDRLHRGHDYAARLESRVSALPARADEVEDPATAFAMPDDRACSAVFGDGAKSWYGTKRFMSPALAHTQPGAWYVFQGYGVHTC